MANKSLNSIHVHAYRGNNSYVHVHNQNVFRGRGGGRGGYRLTFDLVNVIYPSS